MKFLHSNPQVAGWTEPTAGYLWWKENIY